MSHLKQFLSGLLGAGMLLCLSGCQWFGRPATTPNQPKANSPESDPSISITVLASSPLQDAFVERAAEQFCKAHDNVSIHVEYVKEGEDYDGALTKAVREGSTPVLFMLDGAQDLENWKPMLEPLSDEGWLQRVDKSALAAMNEEGKLYGVPVTISGFGLVCNQAVFRSAGIDLTEVTDFEKLRDAFSTLGKKIKSEELKSQWENLESVSEFPAASSSYLSDWVLGSLLGIEFDTASQLMQAQSFPLKHSDGLKALVDLQADYSRYAQEKEKLNVITMDDASIHGLATHRIAAVLASNEIYTPISDADATAAQQLTMLPVAISGSKQDSILVGAPAYWCINVNAQDTQKIAAKEFLQWLYTSQDGNQLLMKEYQLLPIIKNYPGQPPESPLAAAVLEYIRQGRTIPYVSSGLSQEAGSQFAHGVRSYLSGDATWEEVLSQVDEKLSKDSGAVSSENSEP